MFRKKLKILMVQTMNMNLGDSVLADNDCYLMKKAMGLRSCDLLRYSISSRDFSQVKYVDAVVFAGGIIKCTNENFWQYMPEIINEAQKYNVPVFLSAIGVEKFYPDDMRSVSLKKALNQPCIKGISVRDDIDTLKRDYIENKNIKLYSVHDPAVWCAQTYKKYIKNKKQNTELVGLGITREKLFADYGNPQIDRQFQLDFWKGIILELDKRNVKWKVFTNGDTYDEIFAKEVLSYVGHGEKLSAPLDAQTLVSDISQFSSVIAGRMHSNIVSYALSIPSIGFVWNQKLRFWGEKIGYSERFIECDNLTVENVINAWEKAKAEGCAINPLYKNGVFDALKDFSKTIRYREKESENLMLSQKLVAASLGGIEIRYKNTNSKQAYEYSTKLGYKNFHVDLRLSADNKLVCVHRWHKETFRIMNHEKKNEEKPTAIPHSEFVNCKYYNRFDAIDFDTLMSLAKNNIAKKDHRFILSVGRPKAEDFATMISCIKEVIEKYNIKTENLYLRLEQKRDIDYAKKSALNIKLMYYAIDKKLSEEETLEFLKSSLEYCKKKNIKYLYFNHNVYTEEFDKLCKQYGIKCCSSTCVLTDKVINNIKNNAHFVFNQYYDVKYIKRLTR